MAHNAAPTQKLHGNEWRVLGTLVPYLLEYKWRVALALACLITAKLANVGVPLVMKQVVDRLEGAVAIVAVPVALLAGLLTGRSGAVSAAAYVVGLLGVSVAVWLMRTNPPAERD